MKKRIVLSVLLMILVAVVTISLLPDRVSADGDHCHDVCGYPVMMCPNPCLPGHSLCATCTCWADDDPNSPCL